MAYGSLIDGADATLLPGKLRAARLDTAGFKPETTLSEGDFTLPDYSLTLLTTAR